MRTVLLLWVGMLAGLACSSKPKAPHVSVSLYDGDLFPDIPFAARQVAEMGALEFSSNTLARKYSQSLNGTSCADCHNVPTLGGAGTSYRDLVFVRRDEKGVATVAHRFSRRSDGAFAPREPLNTSPRKPPPLYGIGLFESVSQADLLRYSDSVSRIYPSVRGRLGGSNGVVGRFGREGRIPSLAEAVAHADRTELGLAGDSAAMLREVLTSRRMLLTEYIRNLAPPPRRMLSNNARRGQTLFRSIGCVACHRELLLTGATHAPATTRKIFSPYSDLLVHNIRAYAGSGLRTAPLWGVSSSGPPFLHDGSASDLWQAISAHRGEAEPIRAAFDALPAHSRQAIVRFLQEF